MPAGRSAAYAHSYVVVLADSVTVDADITSRVPQYSGLGRGAGADVAGAGWTGAGATGAAVDGTPGLGEVSATGEGWIDGKAVEGVPGGGLPAVSASCTGTRPSVAPCVTASAPNPPTANATTVPATNRLIGAGMMTGTGRNEQLAGRCLGGYFQSRRQNPARESNRPMATFFARRATRRGLPDPTASMSRLTLAAR